MAKKLQDKPSSAVKSDSTPTKIQINHIPGSKTEQVTERFHRENNLDYFSREATDDHVPEKVNSIQERPATDRPAIPEDKSPEKSTPPITEKDQ